MCSSSNGMQRDFTPPVSSFSFSSHAVSSPHHIKTDKSVCLAISRIPRGLRVIVLAFRFSSAFYAHPVVYGLRSPRLLPTAGPAAQNLLAIIAPNQKHTDFCSISFGPISNRSGAPHLILTEFPSRRLCGIIQFYAICFSKLRLQLTLSPAHRAYAATGTIAT